FSGRRILITGGLGFIGSNLAWHLVELGARVTLVDSLVPEYGGNLANITGLEDRLPVNISHVRDEHSMRYLVPGQDYPVYPATPIRWPTPTPTWRSTAGLSFPSSRRAARITRGSRWSSPARGRSTASPSTCRWTRSTCCTPWTSTASTRWRASSTTSSTTTCT